MIKQVFERTEIKYLLTPVKYRALMNAISEHLEKDYYYKSTNCSIYFDTDDKYLAIHSLEKPIYKEKVRVRSYNVPKSLNDQVFIEIKKKFDGTGYKRRISATLKGFYDYLETGHLVTNNQQIKAELDYCLSYYHLKPSLYLAYDRLSYYDKDDQTFRITFDSNVRSRETDLFLEHGDEGELYFNNGEVVMEVKSVSAFPVWFTNALSKLRIYPASFSKYGRVCQKLAQKPAERLAQEPAQRLAQKPIQRPAQIIVTKGVNYV